MMKIEKNNFSQWKLLLKVLSGEISNKDPEFRCWLEKNEENKRFYQRLKGKRLNDNAPFDKDKMFDNISGILNLSVRKKIPFHQKTWFKYAASILVLVSVGLSGYYMYTKDNSTSPETYTRIEKKVFDPGSKKAYLLSSQGKAIDLSESFEHKNSDGTIVSNKSEGILRYRKSDSAAGKKEEFKKEKVELQTIYVPKSGEYELFLADGSKVYLNSESQLVFPSQFEGDTRQVELTGEAYFEVKKDQKPFIVKTADMKIEVLGTSFNVNAYRNNILANTTLVEGSVQIHIPDNPKAFLLKPDSNFRIDKSTNEISIQKVNTDIYTAWVKGEFVFRNQTLSDIFTQLIRWYDFEIEYEKPAIQNMRFTGSTEKTRPLDYLMKQIQAVTDIKYRNEGKKIILY